MYFEDAKAYSDALEAINLEYKQLLNSPTLERKRKKEKIIRYITHFKFSSLFKMLKLRTILRAQRLSYPEKNNGSNDFLKKYYETPSFNQSRIAIYYCIVGNYDNFQEPIFHPTNVDYYLFTDRPYISKTINILSIPEKLRGLSPSVINRYIKMHPKEFFDNYDYSIYLDGTVRVISDIRQWIVPASGSTVGIAMHLHPSRDCLFDEADACIQIGKGNKEKISNQITNYRNIGMPEHFGLLEATAIVVSLASNVAVELLDNWYVEYLNNESGRDQLALPFVIWKKGLSIDNFGILGNNIKESSLLQVSTKHISK